MPGLALVLAAALSAPPASATVQSIEVLPASPTACDSVALVVKGVMPSPCHTLLRVRLGELKLLPTMGEGANQAQALESVGLAE